MNAILKNMKKIEKALLPGEKAFFPSENAHFLVESPLFFEGHKPLPWENQSNLCTGNGSLDKPHSNSLALSNGRMILNSECNKVLSNKLRGSQHVLHPVPMRVKGQGQEQNSTKRPFFF